MKAFFKKLFGIIESVNRARTATMFVRMGRHDLARNVMLKDDAQF